MDGVIASEQINERVTVHLCNLMNYTLPVPEDDSQNEIFIEFDGYTTWLRRLPSTEGYREYERIVSALKGEPRSAQDDERRERQYGAVTIA